MRSAIATLCDCHQSTSLQFDLVIEHVPVKANDELLCRRHEKPIPLRKKRSEATSAGAEALSFMKTLKEKHSKDNTAMGELVSSMEQSEEIQQAGHKASTEAEEVKGRFYNTQTELVVSS